MVSDLKISVIFEVDYALTKETILKFFIAVNEAKKLN
jgi:uncharacterized membrane protein